MDSGEEYENSVLINSSENTMDKRTVAETILALERAALDAWHKGNPSPYLDLYSEDFTYFDPAHERWLDGWEKTKELYESMRGKVTMEVKRSGKRIAPRCTGVKKTRSGKSFTVTGR